MADIIKIASGTCEICEHGIHDHEDTNGCSVEGCDCTNIGSY